MRTGHRVTSFDDMVILLVNHLSSRGGACTTSFGLHTEAVPILVDFGFRS